MASILYNENLVNGVEVIDDPNHDQLYLILELCDRDICEFDDKKMMYDNSLLLQNKESTDGDDFNNLAKHS